MDYICVYHPDLMPQRRNKMASIYSTMPTTHIWRLLKKEIRILKEKSQASEIYEQKYSNVSEKNMFKVLFWINSLKTSNQ